MDSKSREVLESTIIELAKREDLGLLMMEKASEYMGKETFPYKLETCFIYVFFKVI